MLRGPTPISFVKYQPYAMALQVRFKWRHRVDENWRRLMDASCFAVDWIGRPRYNTMSQFGGNWSHYICCAHCIAPWDYPNFYPPAGPTRFVSKITATDCETQIRQPSMQGEIVYKTFASKFNTYIHRNPRLDLAVVHVEQALKRTQEVKMMWMMNEGFHTRPRFEVLEELKEGDTVWIYGCTARGDVFDEESRKEPLMVPTGVRGTVRLVLEEHFFVDTSEDELSGNIQMGMCGSAVIKDGKCVGMLTSTVASTNDDTRVANCAMCTHAKDIREFLLEVEQQMKTAPPVMDNAKTMFQERRESEGKAPEQFRDWEEDEMRIARHVKVPVSLWKFEEQWACEEDKVSSMLFGPNGGIFGKEEQEETLGIHPQDTKDDGKAPEGAGMHNPDGSKPHHTSNRPDPSDRYRHTYLNDAFIDHSEDDMDSNNAASSHVKDFYRGTMGADETDQVDRFSRSMEAMRQQRAREDLHETAMNIERMKEEKKKETMKTTEEEFYDRYHPTGGSEFGASEKQRQYHPEDDQKNDGSESKKKHDSGTDDGNNVADRAAKQFSQEVFMSEQQRAMMGGGVGGDASSSKGLKGPKPSIMKDRQQQHRGGGLRGDDEDLEGIWGKH